MTIEDEQQIENLRRRTVRWGWALTGFGLVALAIIVVLVVVIWFIAAREAGLAR